MWQEEDCKPAGKPQEKPTRPTPCFGLLVSRTMREQISVVEAPNLVFCYGGPRRLVVVQSPSRVHLFATHGLQHTRPPCPSQSPGVCPSSCSLHRWCHPAISSSDTLFSFCPQSSSAPGTFSNESSVHIRWPKYWSFCFSISPSSEYSELISHKID